MGRWLLALGPVLAILLLLLPWPAASSGEVNLQSNISKSDVQVGEEVVFGTGQLPEPGTTVRWDFGDGSPEVTGWPVTHAYTQAGRYTVNARVTYPSTGTTVAATPATIVVRDARDNLPPVAKALVSPRQTLAGLPIAFDASGSTDPEGRPLRRYLWNFGDGSFSEQVQGEHAYARPGVYNIILTVTDDGELDGSDIISVTVTALPEALFSGLNRAMPPCEMGPPPPPFAPLIMIDLGLWESDRYNLLRELEYINLPLPLCTVATSNQWWLQVTPTDESRAASATAAVTEIRQSILVRDTSLLPRAHTSWGTITLVINGWVIETPVAITVRGPTDRDISAEVWELYDAVLAYVTDEARERSVMVYTPRYANGADMALGLITEYVIERGYGGRMPREDFVVKTAELLLGVDRNGDGIVGFTDIDRGLGVKAR